MAQVKFYRGLSTGYVEATHKDGIYFQTDTQTIKMGNKEYGGFNKNLFNGVIMNLDVEGSTLTFDKIVNGNNTPVTIKLIEAGNKSIVVEDIVKDGGVKDGSKIKVNVKNVGTADGLKLGDEGLYVDLTNTTASITKEVARAKDEEGKLDAAIKQEVKDRTNAINGLTLATTGGDGKVITTVEQTNGKVTATAIDLNSSNVLRTATSDVVGQVDMTGTTVEAALVDLAKAVDKTSKAAATYSVKKVTEGLTENVKEAYQLVQTINGKTTDIEVQIPIYKDRSLKSVELTDTNDTKSGQFMKYTYTTENGTEEVVYVDVSNFLVEAEFKNGLQVSKAGEVSIKLADGNEKFLTVDDKGVKLSGVQTAINASKTTIVNGASTGYDTLKGLEDNLKKEVNRATTAEEANKTKIDTLNGEETVDGSVKKAVKDAKDALQKNIDNVAAAAKKGHTKVNAKTDGRVTVTVATSIDGTGDVVTIAENDIAQATKLTDEITRAKAAEDKIESSVGLAADGSHVTTKGNYTKAATTVVGEIAALDSQMYTNTQNITAVTTIANKNKEDIATIKGNLAVASAVTVKGSTNITVTEGTDGTDKHKVFTVTAKDLTTTEQHNALSGRVTNTEKSITTLNADANTKGSVDNKIQVETNRATTAEAKALADAKSYTDTALTWEEVGAKA